MHPLTAEARATPVGPARRRTIDRHRSHDCRTIAAVTHRRKPGPPVCSACAYREVGYQSGTAVSIASMPMSNANANAT